MRILSSPAIFWASASSWAFTASGISAESAGKAMRTCPSVAAAGGIDAVCVCSVEPVAPAAAVVPSVPVPVIVPTVAAGAGGAAGGAAAASLVSVVPAAGAVLVVAAVVPV